MTHSSSGSSPGPGGNGCAEGSDFDWAADDAVERFKKQVFWKYIVEVIFDVVISVFSVVTDVVSLGMYLKVMDLYTIVLHTCSQIVVIQKKRWGIALLTAIPVLLPTIIFTNVYLADETQGYCKLPKRKRKVGSRSVSESDEKVSTSTAGHSQANSETPLEQFHAQMDFHCGTCHMLCLSCKGCMRYDLNVKIKMSFN